jgi:serine/threonine protein kinase/tetratricopeptide (TPR) repeat protein
VDEEELRWTEPNDTPGGGTLVGGAVDPANGETDFEPGATLGRYVVLARMGSGGMGVVYAAYDPQLDRRIALKLMHQRGDDEAQAEHASRRMLAEAKAMAQLSHPNVITVHDVGTIDGRVFIAMEFVEGVPLTQWMRQPGRDWQQQLEVFIKAGRGLEAAHAVGLVHRDFKPDNVLVGADGRVRVLDFGLARRFDGQREAGEKRDREAGTPAYMSPEQHLGNPLDHRADQFSFCVALYEALYGELPFAARTRFELALAVTDGRVGPAPKRATVPNSVRWALLRGLDPDPEGRWPDMASLLSELGRDPYRRMRTMVISSAATLGVLALVVGGVFLVNRFRSTDTPTPPPPSDCSSAADELAEVWNPEQVAAVRKAFAKVDEPWAVTLGPEVETKLDTWARGWEAMHVATCEATAEGRQSPELLDHRMLCLERIRAEFGGLVEVMTGAEATSLAQIGEAVSELPPLSECDAATVERGSHTQREAAEQLVAEQIERDLVRARSLELTGAFAQARELTVAAIVAAKGIDDQRVVATGLLMQARIEIATGGAEAAVPLLEEAELAAERAGADRLRGDILIAIARLDAEVGHAEAATARVREARAVLDRVGADAVEHAELDGVAALASLAAGDLQRAEQQVRDAIESIAEFESGASPESDSPAMPDSPDSPDIPPVELAQLHATLGLVLRELDPPAARIEFERAAQLWTLHYGPQHPTIGQVRYEQAIVEEREGRYEEAVQNYEAASKVFEQVFGPDSIAVGRAVAALARNLGELGLHEESLHQYQRARQIFKAYGDATAELAQALDGEALVQRRHGDPKLAIDLHQQALQLLERGGRGIDEFDLADVHVHLGEALLDLDRTPEAREQLEEAVQLLDQTSPGKASERRAVVRRLAAGAWATGEDRDLDRARILASRARSEFVALSQADAVTELDAWLSTLEVQG